MEQAIILAAGRGERLVSGLPYPKPLQRVNGQPLIVRVLRGLERGFGFDGWQSRIARQSGSQRQDREHDGACGGGQADHLFWVHRGAGDRRHFAAAFGGGGAINLVGIGCLIDGGPIGASA